MTTDTAVRVTRTIVQQQGLLPSTHRTRSIADVSRVPVPLADIIFVDNPELRVDQHESTEMPFRYMADEKGMPIMPDVGFPFPLPDVQMKIYI